MIGARIIEFIMLLIEMEELIANVIFIIQELKYASKILLIVLSKLVFNFIKAKALRISPLFF